MKCSNCGKNISEECDGDCGHIFEIGNIIACDELTGNHYCSPYCHEDLEEAEAEE